MCGHDCFTGGAQLEYTWTFCPGLGRACVSSPVLFHYVRRSCDFPAGRDKPDCCGHLIYSDDAPENEDCPYNDATGDDMMRGVGNDVSKVLLPPGGLARAMAVMVLVCQGFGRVVSLNKTNGHALVISTQLPRGCNV